MSMAGDRHPTAWPCDFIEISNEKIPNYTMYNSFSLDVWLAVYNNVWMFAL